MKINTDTHYLFRMTNMEDEDKHGYTLLLQTWKMRINTDTHYLFGMDDASKHGR